MKRIGAGGNWKRIDERFDTKIIKQTSGLSCVSAVGEMLLKSRGIALSQAQIIDIIGEPAYFSSLAEALNKFDVPKGKKKWHGIIVTRESLDFLLEAESLAVILREPFEMGHAVLVSAKTRGGLIKIKDPFDQTTYKMTEESFLKHWNGEAVFYGRIV